MFVEHNCKMAHKERFFMIRFEDFYNVFSGNATFIFDGHKVDFLNEERLEIYKNYVVTSIEQVDKNLVINLESPTPSETKYWPDECWYQDHVKQFGTEPDFF